MKRKDIRPAPDERLELLFRHAGLSEKQAKLYRQLLEDGDARASALSRRTGIKRSNAYALLKDLAGRGIVTEFEKGKIIYYRPEPPAKLLEVIDAREKDVRLARQLASEMVPKLTSQWKKAIDRPTIKQFEGAEGIRQVFEDIYAPKKDPVYGCVDLEASDQAFPQYILKTLIPKRIKHGVYAYSFIADSPATREIQKKDKEELRSSILIDKKTFPLPAEIDVYEDKIAMMTFRNGEFIGLIIEQKDIAETMRSIFKIATDALRKQRTSDDPPKSPLDQKSAPDLPPAQTPK